MVGPFYYDFWPRDWPDNRPGRSNDGFHNHHIVARYEWGAKKPRYRMDAPRPLSTFRFRFAETDQCTSFSDCSEIVRGLQLEHLRAGYADIQYSFLIGGDDNYYEGVGWRFYVKDIAKGAQDEDEPPSVIFAYICREKDFNEDRKLRRYMEEQGQQLLEWGFATGKMEGHKEWREKEEY